MKKSFRIFRRDLSRLMHNRAAILVTIGVCLLPSLYAWLNIAANIDPYGNTSGIKIAVANNDTQATDQDITKFETLSKNLTKTTVAEGKEMK